MIDDDELDKWIDDPLKYADGESMVEFDDNEITAPPPSADEVKKARLDLAQWHSPDVFRKTAIGLCNRCRSSEFFNNPLYGFLRDAFVIAEFVRHKQVDKVRLANPSDQWPDGHVRMGGKVENVAVTSAQVPGRRMGKEYKFKTKFELEHINDAPQRAKSIPGALEKAINDKLKRYGDCSRMWLVVYLNINEYGIQQLERESKIIAIRQHHATSFGNLFVLWKDKLIQPCPIPAPSPSPT